MREKKRGKEENSTRFFFLPLFSQTDTAQSYIRVLLWLNTPTHTLVREHICISRRLRKTHYRHLE